MSTFGTQSSPRSTVLSISDLDGFTIRDYSFPPNQNYAPAQDDDFGFDPPQLRPSSLSSVQAYSPPNDLSLSGWPELKWEEDTKQTDTMNLDSYEMNRFITSTLPNVNTAVSRYGQMTPPRSTSAASSDFKTEEKLSPKKAAPGRRKKSKTQSSKDADPTPSGRKRKSTRKASAASAQGDSLEEQKRKQSLEKNRLAAAKCRINKKEKTEKLQRDSHDKAVQNAYLRDQVIRMKDEIQQMNAILLAHAHCDGCRSPREIQAHLNDLGNDFYNQQVALSGHSLGNYPPLNFSELAALTDSYLSSATQNTLLNPPLPEFNRSAEFEVHTPMQTD